MRLIRSDFGDFAERLKQTLYYIP